MAKRPRCSICRSRRWHRDRQSGLVVCEEGHILQGYVQEDNEAEGVSQHATKLRKLRKNKEKKKRKTANLDFFHGPRQRFLFFQCAQIILRKQIAAIIEEWKLPLELESIARDLWTMYVSLTNLEAEPFKDGEDEKTEEGNNAESSVHHNDAPRDSLQKLYDELSDSEDDTPGFNSRPDTLDALLSIEGGLSDEQGDGDDNNTEREDKVTNSPPRGTQSLSAPRHKSQGQAFDPSKALRLQYTLVICYLACLTMRVPIMMKDILDLASSYRIDYLEALQAIPADMRKHLEPNKTASRFLEEHVLPVIGLDGSHASTGFAFLVTSFARMYRTRCEVTFPDINAAPVLWKQVKGLGLPPFMYLVARRTLILLGPSMGLDCRSRRTSLAFPDLTLAASLVVTLKLLWGLDGQPRIPQDANDMASALPRLSEWLDFAMRLQVDYPSSLVPRAAKATNVTSLSTDDIDQFLDMYEQCLLDDNDIEKQTVLGTLPLPKSGIQVSKRFFPLPSTKTFEPVFSQMTSTAERRNAAIESFYASMSTPIPGEAASVDPLFPGQGHKIYSSRDREGDLPEDYARVLDLVSEVTGIRNRAIEVAVRKMELKLTTVEDSRINLLSEQLPLEGIEAGMFGKLRQQGGKAPWPRYVARSAKRETQEKQEVLMMPKMHV